MLAVMLELAKRVADRSPPLKSTSAASALAMFNTLSVRALTSSREYIRDAPEAPARGERGGIRKTSERRGLVSSRTRRNQRDESRLMPTAVRRRIQRYAGRAPRCAVRVVFRRAGPLPLR